MSDYSAPTFAKKEIEISEAISVLNRHGLNLSLPEKLQNEIDATFLFDGDDGLFKDLIKSADVYFEYGCGKSTEYVFRHTSASIFAVDTSNDWVNKLSGLKSEGSAERLNLNWIDVGEIGNWGYPTTFRLRQNFKAYAELLWLNKKKPDLVLIDGRFRVFCFLTSIKLAPIGTKILFDDYTDRPFYHVVEEFSKKLDTCGRQALFEVDLISKQKVTDEIIFSFQNVIN
ncbi:hypothetical protein N9582_02885 [Amylibacter sp.]|nr:hypothetical protein [Amylibacter sp.]